MKSNYLQTELELTPEEAKITEEALRSQYWRLNNLYYIKDKAGKKILFKFNVFQEVLYRTLWYWNIVLKARQLGMTTFFCILYLDAVLFQENKTAGIIAHTEKDAKRIFKDKIRFAFDNLPDEIRIPLEIKTDSTEELTFKNGSSIFVSVSTRSGTIQYLHISEFGYTCKKYPEKAEEIVTGALNSVERGQMVSIESTAKGRQGFFFDFCQVAQMARKACKTLSELEFKFFFFPWWQNKEYILQTEDILPQSLVDYFEKLRIEQNIQLTEEQKQWYYHKFKSLREEMYSEYPSTPEEAFLVANESAYYGKEMMKVMEQNRITFVPHKKTVPVDTWWDLGMNDFNVILFTQIVGKEIRFINMYYNRGEGLAHYANVLRRLRDDEGYNYGIHYLPHDIDVKELGTGIARKKTLYDLKVSPIRVVPRIGIQEGIEMTRNIFNRFWFDKQRCEKLADALINYRQEWDDKLGQPKDKPLHDDNSHFADAVRSVGVMFRDNSELAFNDFDVMKEGERYGLFPTIG